jgi:arsenate reductase (glutaredoxin)
MNLKVYVYDKCSTCRKALKFLDENGIQHSKFPIREQPPTESELTTMLEANEGEMRKLFNTSGMDYRQLNIKDKLAEMTKSEAIKLLAGNGNLIKRPFGISEKVRLIGFKEEIWKTKLDV